MQKKFSSVLICAGAICFLMSMSGCSKTPAEEAIRANIEYMQQAAQDKEPGNAVEFLADGFVGNHGIDKMGLRRIMMGVFLRHKNINVAITRMDIEVNPQDPFSASMNCVVVVSGAENILPQDGRIYKVTGEWQFIEKEWMLVRAGWE